MGRRLRLHYIGPGLSWCQGLNENGTHRCICLSTWSPVGGIIWEGVRGVVLMEEVCYRGMEGFEMLKDLALSQSALCLLAVDSVPHSPAASYLGDRLTGPSNL